MDLLVSIDTIGPHVVVTLRGQADLSSVPLLHSGLQRVIADHPGRRVVVDLDGLVALDDDALGVLLGAAARVRDLGGDLAVVCTNARVVDRLRTTRFDLVIDVLDGLDDEPPGRRLEPSRPGARVPTGAADVADPDAAASPTLDRYVAVIFTSRRSGADPDGYARASDRMDRLAAEQPGFRGIESVRGADGVGITVSYWDSDADARAWKAHHEHLDAQRAGRARWYEWYRVRIATVVREYAHNPHDGSADRDEGDRSNETEPLLHLALPADWETARVRGEYATSTRGRTLDDEGFIHCSYPRQLAGVANRFYADLTELVVLHIDPDLVGAEIRVEPAVEGGIEGGVEGGVERFPHVYGPIPTTAVVATTRWERADNGRWHRPPTL